MKNWLKELTHKGVYCKSNKRYYKKNSRKFYAFMAFLVSMIWLILMGIIIILSIPEKSLILDGVFLLGITTAIFGNLHFALDNVDDPYKTVALTDAIMTIHKSGKVGIGTQSPTSLLHLNTIANGSNTGIEISTSTDNGLIYVNGTGDLVLKKNNNTNFSVIFINKTTCFLSIKQHVFL